MIKLDTVYMIVLPDDRGVIYDTIGESAKESWQKANSIMGKFLSYEGNTIEKLRANGYRAKRVEIILKEER